MTLFLIEYDRQTQKLVSLHEYSDADHVRAASDLREREAAKASHIEIVILQGKALEDIKRTHSRYFKTARELAEF